MADVVEEAQEPYSAVYSLESVQEASRREAKLLEQVKHKLLEQGFREENIKTETYLNLRYEGTDTAIMVKRQGSDDTLFDYASEFVSLFQREYGFKLQNRNLLVCDVRVRGVGVTNILKPKAQYGFKRPCLSPKLEVWKKFESVLMLKTSCDNPSSFNNGAFKGKKVRDTRKKTTYLRNNTRVIK